MFRASFHLVLCVVFTNSPTGRWWAGTWCWGIHMYEEVEVDSSSLNAFSSTFKKQHIRVFFLLFREHGIQLQNKVFRHTTSLVANHGLDIYTVSSRSAFPFPHEQSRAEHFSRITWKMWQRRRQWHHEENTLQTNQINKYNQQQHAHFNNLEISYSWMEQKCLLLADSLLEEIYCQPTCINKTFNYRCLMLFYANMTFFPS